MNLLVEMQVVRTKHLYCRKLMSEGGPKNMKGNHRIRIVGVIIKNKIGQNKLSRIKISFGW